MLFLESKSDTTKRRILSERHGYRIAVIINEFADTAVRCNLNSMSNVFIITEQDLEGSLCSTNRAAIVDE